MTEQNNSGRYAYEGLDRVIHEKARLSILTSLVAHPEGLLFGDLKDLCSLTDGNLSRHLDILRKADLVQISKSVVQGRSQTLIQLTTDGRQRFLEYLQVLEAVISDAARAEKKAEGDAAGLEGLSPA